VAVLGVSAASAGQWALDSQLTLSLDGGTMQTERGVAAALTASAALPRELVESWTDEGLHPTEATATPVARGYRVCIEVRCGGEKVTPYRSVLAPARWRNWVGVVPSRVADRVVWKRCTLTRVTVARSLDQPPAEYEVTVVCGLQTGADGEANASRCPRCRQATGGRAAATDGVGNYGGRR